MVGEGGRKRVEGEAGDFDALSVPRNNGRLKTLFLSFGWAGGVGGGEVPRVWRLLMNVAE
jgi:hypothetical protein